MKEGFVNIIVLIVVCILITMIIYLIYILKLNYLILNATNNNIQSYYQSEGKLYLSFYDENYYNNQLYPILLDVFRKNDFNSVYRNIIINNNDLEPGDDFEKVNVAFTDNNDRKKLQLIAKSNCNGINTRLISSGNVVNELFEIRSPVLCLKTIDNKYKESLKELLENIDKNISIKNCYKPEKVFGIECLDYDKIILSKKDTSNYEISSSRETMVNPYIERFNNEEIFVIARNQEGKKLDFFIGSPDNLYDTIKLSGVIFVEGNVIISSEFKFKGIIIVKGGEIIVNSRKSPNIRGLIIMENLVDYDQFIENVAIKYERRMLYRYGTYIPGFLEPKMTVIKCD